MSKESSKVEEQDAISFEGFILGLSGAALSYLGLWEKESNPSTKNLTLARQNIEILSMLEKKTTGNLNEDEAKLLKTVLLDLKVKFVEASKSL